MPDASSTSTLSSWAGPYVERLLQQGEAFANLPYTPYDKPLSAGFTAPQTTALTGIANLTQPTGFGTAAQNLQTPASGVSSGYTAGTYTPATASYSAFDAQQAQQYMSPYVSGVVDPQMREAKRQAEIARQANAARMTRAGSFGGARQAISESEMGRNLATQLGDIYGKGQQEAYLNAQQQFERDQARRMAAQQQNLQYGLAAQQLNEQAKQQQAQLGLSALDRQLAANTALANITGQEQTGDIARLQAQYGLGAQEQATRQAAIDRDRAEFQREQYQYPMEMLKLRQSFLQGMPIASQQYYQQGPSALQNAAGLASIAANLKNAGFNISDLFSGVSLGGSGLSDTGSSTGLMGDFGT